MTDDGVVKQKSRMIPELRPELLDAALEEVPESNRPGGLFGLDTLRPKVLSWSFMRVCSSECVGDCLLKVT